MAQGRGDPPLDERLAFGAADVEVHERRVAWQGFFRVEALSLRHRLFEGGWSPTVARELFVRRPAVVVVPYDPERDRVVMIEQFRVGALAAPGSPWQLEFVAGISEPGETFEDVARRETQEESGLALRVLEPVCRYHVSPGGTDEEVVIFCGRVDTEGAGGVHGVASESEDIRVHVLALEELTEGMAKGQLRNAAAIIGAQWLLMHREGLRARWLGST